MKPVLFIALVFIGLHSIAQKKDDNLIIIKDPTVTIEQIKKSFIKEGFLIESSDSAHVVTQVLSSGLVGEKLAAFQDGDSITMKGYIKIDLSFGGINTSNIEQVSYSGSKGGGFKTIFDHANKIALSLTNNVTYANTKKR